MENPPATTVPAPITITAQPEMDTVINLIRAMYHETNRESRDFASTWLTTLQSTLYAWRVADQLLLARFDVESCYFAAQTLRTKIQTSFHELPPESYSSLKDSIINHLKGITES